MRQCNVNVLAKLLLVAMLLAVLSPAVVQAADDTDARIEKLEASVQALQVELNALKSERAREAKRPVTVDQKRVDSMVSKAIESKKAEITGTPSWVSNITPFGDLRLRYEYIDDEADGKEARNRNRIRARFGFKAKINDEWDTTVRLATGNSDSPTSTNQTLADDSDSDSFGKKKVWIDLVYADWHPAGIEGLNVYAGKMKNPFYRVGKNQVIWDSDVNPEGGAVSYEYALDRATAAHLTGGGFWIREDSGSGDVSLLGLQGSLKHKFENGTHVLGGVSYYDYGNLQRTDDDDLAINLKGNTPTVAGGDVYKYDYDIVEGFAEYGFKVEGMPVTLFGNYIENTAVAQNNNAWALGFVLNKAKAARSWQFGYYYRDVEPDAVVGGLNDSDFVDGGTDGRGHLFGYKYQWTKNIQSAVTYFDNDRGTDGDDFKRLQLDLIFKF